MRRGAIGQIIEPNPPAASIAFDAIGSCHAHLLFPSCEVSETFMLHRSRFAGICV